MQVETPARKGKIISLYTWKQKPALVGPNSGERAELAVTRAGLIPGPKPPNHPKKSTDDAPSAEPLGDGTSAPPAPVFLRHDRQPGVARTILEKGRGRGEEGSSSSRRPSRPQRTAPEVLIPTPSWGPCLGWCCRPSPSLYRRQQPGPRTDSKPAGSCAVLQALGQWRPVRALADSWIPGNRGTLTPTLKPHFPPRLDPTHTGPQPLSPSRAHPLLVPGQMGAQKRPSR